MNKPDQTLVFLSPGFPANETETNWLPFVQLLIKELKNQFPKLNIIVLSFFYPYQINEYEWNKINVIPFDGMHKRKLKHLLFWRSIWKKLNKIKKENKVIGLF